MVDRAIKVAVLEGDFAAICDLGFPFSLSLHLQSCDIKLSEAMWTHKSSSSGFSVSLYWPSGATLQKQVGHLTTERLPWLQSSWRDSG